MLNVIYNEDCLTGIKKIPDKTVDLVITDPPYKINNHCAGGKTILSDNLNKYNNELYKKISFKYKILFLMLKYRVLFLFLFLYNMKLKFVKFKLN